MRPVFLSPVRQQTVQPVSVPNVVPAGFEPTLPGLQPGATPSQLQDLDAPPRN